MRAGPGWGRRSICSVRLQSHCPPEWAAGASLETSSPLFSSSSSPLPSTPAFYPHLLFPFTAPRSPWTLQYKTGSLFLLRAGHSQSLVMVSCDPSFSPAPLPTLSLRNTLWAPISSYTARQALPVTPAIPALFFCQALTLSPWSLQGLRLQES